MLKLILILTTTLTITATLNNSPTQVKQKLEAHSESLILFTNQTCKKCEGYANMLRNLNSNTDAVRALKNTTPDLGKVDCDFTADFCKEWNVKHFPTLELLYKGERFRYTGFYMEKEIAKFVKDIREKRVIDFNLKDFEKNVKESKLEAKPLTIYVGESSGSLFEKFESLARSFLSDRFYVYNKPLKTLGTENTLLKRIVAEEFGNEPNILIVKNQTGNFYKFDEETDLETLVNYFQGVKHPYLVTNQHELMKMYQEILPLFVMITDSSVVDSTEVSEEFNARAKEQKNNSNFALIDAQEMRSDYLQRFLDEVEVEGVVPDLPAVLYFQPVFETLKYKKHLLQGDLSISNLKQFIKSCIAGEHTPIIRINSKARYEGMPYLALNSENWESQLSKRNIDSAVLLFRENYKTDRDTQEFLKALEFYQNDPTIDIYIFNIQKNDISVFVPDEMKASLLLHLKTNVPKKAQVFQKAGMSMNDVKGLIDKRNEFDKSKFGDSSLEDFDMAEMMKQLENIDFSGILEGLGDNIDMAEMEAALEKIKGMGDMFGGMGGDFDIPGGMNDMNFKDEDL